MKLFESIPEFSLKFLSMLILVLLPVQPIMMAVSVLVMADFITGVWASAKEGQRITSNGLKVTVTKTLAYQAAIVVAFVLESYLIPDMPVVKTVAGLIGITEGKSFFENLRRITGIDFWSVAMKKVQESTTVNSKD